MESRDQFGFRFGQIERHAVGFRHRRSEVAQEADDLRHDIPARDEMQVVAALAFDHGVEIQSIGQQNHADHRQSQRNFVADHLGRAAQPAHQRIFAVRRPAGQRHAVHADRSDGKNEHQPDAGVRDHENRHAHPGKARRAKGNQRNGGQAQGQGQKRRQDVEKLVRTGRREIFLEQEFHSVGQRLQQSMRANFRRPPSRLDVGDQFAFKPGEVRQRR